MDEVSPRVESSALSHPRRQPFLPSAGPSPSTSLPRPVLPLRRHTVPLTDASLDGKRYARWQKWDGLNPSLRTSASAPPTLQGDERASFNLGRELEERVSQLRINKDGSRHYEELTNGTTPGAKTAVPHSVDGVGNEKEAPVILTDCIGRKFQFPFPAVETWKDMAALIEKACLPIEELKPLVSQGRYDLVDSDGKITLPAVWEYFVKPGLEVKMVLQSKLGSVQHTSLGASNSPSAPLASQGSSIRSIRARGDEMYSRTVERLSVHLPHLSNVLGPGCRGREHGRLYCYDAYVDSPPGGKPVLNARLGPGDWMSNPWVIRPLRPSREQAGLLKRTIVVEDLTPDLIEALGSTFWMNPEFFEEHLNRSGYREDSYSEPLPSDWNTHGIAKDHASLRWFRPIRRKGMKPDSCEDRCRLIDTNDPQGARNTWTSTFDDKDFRDRTIRNIIAVEENIFRQELLLSTNPESPISTANGTVPGGWEEKVTFYRANINGAPLTILLTDPVPRFWHAQKNIGRKTYTYGKSVPYDQPYARSPFEVGMAGLFSGEPASEADIERLGSYINSATSTREAIADGAEGRGSQTAGKPKFDIVTRLLLVVHYDTLGFLQLVSSALDEIGIQSVDDAVMQHRLSHWRALIGRLQTELPALRISLASFTRFVGATQPLDVVSSSMTDTLTQIDLMIEKTEKSYAALRADMAVLESKRGIAEAESVGKITELAFIFIPLTFVSSIFSMQIQELQTPAPLYAFILSSVLLITSTYLARVAIRSSAVRAYKRRHFEGVRNFAKIQPGGYVPARAFLMYSLPHVGTKLGEQKKTLALLFTGILTVPILFLWTHHHLNSGFKGILTVVIFIFGATIAMVVTGQFGTLVPILAPLVRRRRPVGGRSLGPQPPSVHSSDSPLPSDEASEDSSRNVGTTPQRTLLGRTRAWFERLMVGPIMVSNRRRDTSPEAVSEYVVEVQDTPSEAVSEYVIEVQDSPSAASLVSVRSHPRGDSVLEV